MRRNILLLFIIFVFVLLPGCGNTNEQEKEKNGSNQSSSSEEIPLGEWKNGEYINEYLGIKIVLPEGWNRYTDEQLKAQATTSQDTKYFAAIYSEQYCSLQTMGGKMIEGYTIEQYAEGLKEGLEATDKVNYTVSPGEKVEVAGKDFICVKTIAEMSGYTISQNYYIAQIKDCLFIAIFTDAVGDSNINDLIKKL